MIDLYSAKIRSYQKKTAGFTLVELMVAIFISLVIIAAVYGAYISQQKSYSTQEQVAEVQQNIRAALYIMAGELHMAGFKIDDDCTDPSGNQCEALVVDSVKKTSPLVTDNLIFEADLEEDGDTADEDEYITYSLYSCSINGETRTCLGRKEAGANNQAIAQDIEAVEFEYLDHDGNEMSATDDIAEDARAIRISILARAHRKAADDLPNNKTFKMPSGDLTYSDTYRRRLLVTTVNLRNMGLN